MSLRKISFLIFCAFLSILSCKKDDDGGSTVVEVRDRAEQQVIDNDLIIEYLTTHYYNEGDFLGNDSPKIADLIITDTKVDGTYRVLYTDDGDDGNDAVRIEDIVFAETNYKYYILELNKGAETAVSPNFSDAIRVVYEGVLMDDEATVFDSAVTPVTLNLVGNGSTITGLIAGWRKVIPQFKVAESIEVDNDGIVSYNNHGSGVMFLPSGLAYFSISPSNDVPEYTPLMFKFDLLQSFEVDHDGDGVPSHEEDLNGDGEFTARSSGDDDDTDGDGLPNYVDADDDGDGVLTIDEDLEDTDLDIDSDGDGDKTNDKNGDGDPRNDDTDGDGNPNYLDVDDSESRD